MASRPRSSKGFSLVEMMISIVLGLIVVSGLVSVLMANRAAYTIQQGSNFNQESLRFAATRLAWSLRMADFWGGVKAKDLTPTTNTTGMVGIGDCDAAWVLNVGAAAQGNGITGYDGGDTFPIANCVDDANYVKYSDVVVMRYADTHGYDPAKASSTTDFDSTTPGDVPNQTSIFVVSAVNQSATMFRLGEAVPSNPLGSTSGRYVYPYQIEMYYLSPCSDPGADGKCGTADDGDADARSPTLMRMRMNSTGTLISEAVVDGIEQLQFEYASPQTPTTAATSFQQASLSNFATVTQVRASIVARSTTRDDVRATYRYVRALGALRVQDRWGWHGDLRPPDRSRQQLQRFARIQLRRQTSAVRPHCQYPGRGLAQPGERMTMATMTKPMRAQRGVALFVGLIFLLVLSIIAVMAMRGTLTEMKMVTNVARHEACLRDIGSAARRASDAVRPARVRTGLAGQFTGGTVPDSDFTIRAPSRRTCSRR